MSEGTEGVPVLSEYHSCAKFDEVLVSPFLRPRRYTSSTWETDEEDARTVSKKQYDEEDYQKLCEWLDNLFPHPSDSESDHRADGQPKDKELHLWNE